DAHIALILCSFFFQCYGPHRDLHSFPTRRSSDLGGKSAADKGKDTRDYLAAAFPELNAWERAGADASSAGMVDAGFEEASAPARSEERFSRNAETDLVCRLLLEKKKTNEKYRRTF